MKKSLNLDEAKVLLRQWAESNPEVRALAIFGSYAKGNQHECSDLDIALLVSDPFGREDPDTVLISEDQGWTEEISNLLQFPKDKVRISNAEDALIIEYLKEARILVYCAELDNNP